MTMRPSTRPRVASLKLVLALGLRGLRFIVYVLSFSDTHIKIHLLRVLPVSELGLQIYTAIYMAFGFRFA